MENKNEEEVTKQTSTTDRSAKPTWISARQATTSRASVQRSACILLNLNATAEVVGFCWNRASLTAQVKSETPVQLGGSNDLVP
jgi:hypothetical protein